MDKEIEVMRITRVPPLGKLVVWVGEQAFYKLSDVPSGPLRQRLMAAIGELIVFADGYEVLVDAGLAPPPAAASVASAHQPIARSVEERKAAFMASVEKQQFETRSMASEQLGNASPAIPESDPKSPAAVDLATQINAILERKVAANPLLHGRTIQLRPDPLKGITIFVDGQIFETPEEIEDQLVRDTIREAAREWDAR